MKAPLIGSIVPVNENPGAESVVRVNVVPVWTNVQVSYASSQMTPNVQWRHVRHVPVTSIARATPDTVSVRPRTTAAAHRARRAMGGPPEVGVPQGGSIAPRILLERELRALLVVRLSREDRGAVNEVVVDEAAGAWVCEALVLLDRLQYRLACRGAGCARDAAAGGGVEHEVFPGGAPSRPLRTLAVARSGVAGTRERCPVRHHRRGELATAGLVRAVEEAPAFPPQVEMAEHERDLEPVRRPEHAGEIGPE